MFTKCHTVLDPGAGEREMQKLQKLIHDPCYEITHSPENNQDIKISIFIISYKQDQFSVSVFTVNFLMVCFQYTSTTHSKPITKCLHNYMNT